MISHAVTAHWTIFTERILQLAMEGSNAWLEEGNRKAEVQKEQSIFIRLSEIPTSELHKYLYLYLYVLFIIHNHLSLPD